MKKLEPWRQAVVSFLSFLVATVLHAQAVTPVPQLDMNRFSGTWYEIARYPIKSEKLCARDMTMLFALGDKPTQYQLVKSCQTKKDYSQIENIDGKQAKSGDGSLRSKHLVLFHHDHVVLAIDPEYQWAVIGAPNHTALTILSRTPTMAPAVLAQAEAQATAKGFAVAKLVMLPQDPVTPMTATASEQPMPVQEQVSATAK